MSQTAIKWFKVLALPLTLVADSVYVVKADGDPVASIYVTDSNGVAFATTKNTGVLTVADQAARLALTDLTIGQVVYQSDNGFRYTLNVFGGESVAANWSPIPKRYKAIITQTGTNNPNANVLENTLGGTPVWARVAPGFYSVTLSNAFTLNKTLFTPKGSLIYNFPGDIKMCGFHHNTASSLYFITSDVFPGGIGANVEISSISTGLGPMEIPICIEVYP